jgi:hypothetical protein
VKHADVCPPNTEHPPAARGESQSGTGLALLIPPPDGGDVIAHRGGMHLEAELAVRGVAGRRR